VDSPFSKIVKSATVVGIPAFQGAFDGNIAFIPMPVTFLAAYTAVLFLPYVLIFQDFSSHKSEYGVS
jgi:hypothetical protein